MNVAVLGASRNPDRYSYKAVKKLQEKGHIPLPVHPCIKDIEGLPVFARLGDIPEAVDTVTVYLSAIWSAKITDEIANCGARRVIFNPGAENPGLAAQLEAKGMKVVEACTLVLLATGQF